MSRRALLIALLAAPLALTASCKNKKKAPPAKAPPAAAAPAAPAPAAPAASGGVDRRVEAAKKALQEAAARRQRQLDNVGK